MLRITGCVLAAVLAWGCGDAAPEGAAPGSPIQVVDHAGRAVTLGAPAERVIALIPAATELVLTLGAGDRLVARTDYDTQPELRALPSVGGGLTPSLEWLVERRPELVIAWPDGASRSVVGRLTESGVAVYGARLESVEAVLDMTRDVGALLGRSARADSLVANIEARLTAVAARTAGLVRPRVLYVVSRDPVYIAGPGSFIDELLALAGAENVFADAPDGWPQVALEEVVARQPDIILIPDEPADAGHAAALAGLPGWRDLEAVRAGRVFTLPGELFNRPGPRIAETAERLASVLHPTSG